MTTKRSEGQLEDQPIKAGYLRGLRPSQVTFEVMMQRLHDPEFNPLAGVDPVEVDAGEVDTSV